MLGFYNYSVILTYFSLISGCVGIFLSAGGNTGGAVVCLMLSGFFDLFDGKVASTCKRSDDAKKFGIQIDSLADLVCFGVLPVMIGYSMGMTEYYWYPLMAVYVLAALIRLAYFNVMEEKRQKQTSETRKCYNGMPVTTVAILIPIMYFVFKLIGEFNYCIPYGVAIGVFAVAFLVKSLKIKKLKGKFIYIFAGVAVLAIAIGALILCLA